MSDLLPGFVPVPISAAKSKVGNFVEVKNAKIGIGAKINHLTYIGDATVGRGSKYRRRYDHLQL